MPSNSTLTRKHFAMIAALVFAIATSATSTATATVITIVPGYANPWLAGMPDGSPASGDIAPDHSPVHVAHLEFRPFDVLTFNATGSVSNGLSAPNDSPDGVDQNGGIWWPQHNAGVENGIGNIFRSPGNALMGVFLSDQRPDLTPAPPTLDFQPAGNVARGINYLSLAPRLKQPFFIGDGVTNTGMRQQIIAPTEASRLFLGSMDSTGWYNNWGEFQVAVSVVPEPTSLALAIVALTGCLFRSRRRRLFRQ